MTPFFSIIIATYNRRTLTANTVDRVLLQTFSEFEVILVDDGSTDDSYAYLSLRYSGDERVKVIHQENAERGSARNNGIRQAIGEYLVFVDSDDFIDSDHLATLFQYIQQESQPNFLTCKFDFIKDGKTTGAPIERLTQGYYDYRILLNGNVLGMYSCARRKNHRLSLFETNRDYAIFEDWMFNFQNLRHDRIYLIDRTTYHINDHSDRSMHSQYAVLSMKIRKATEWIADRVELSMAETRDLNAFIHYFSAIHAYAANAPAEAKRELKKAHQIKGIQLRYLVLWIKCIVGKSLSDRVKLALQRS